MTICKHGFPVITPYGCRTVFRPLIVISISLSLLLAITKGTSLLTPVSILPFVFNASVVVVFLSSTTSPIITSVKSFDVS